MHRSIENKTEQRRKRIQREGKEQAALFKQAAWQYAALPDRYPGLNLMFAIPNGAYLQGDKERRAIQGQRLRRQGVKEGVSDILLPVPRGVYHGLWIEMKAQKPHDAAVTDDQWWWIGQMNSLGYEAEVAYGSEHAWSFIEAYYALGKPTGRVLCNQ